MRSPIVVEAAAVGVALGASQWEELARYRDMVLEWSQRFNLTAIRDPEAIEERLILDALRMIPALDRAVDGAVSSRLGGGTLPRRLIDIGTGAGLPGLPLAIARPDIMATLLDATGKKVRFLDHVVADLGLANARAVHGRAEDLGHDPAHRGTHDVVTARAVSALPTLLELAAPFLRRGGVALFPKSLDLAAELAAGERAAPMVGMAITSAEALPASATRLVVATKRGDTPTRYPRRAGVPAHEPLGGVVPAQAGRSRGEAR